MNINQTKFDAVVESAKAKAAGNARWLAAIEKAAAGLQSGWIVTELYDGVMVTTENGTYHANGSCQCQAFKHNQPCKHRALARLIERYNELDAAVAVASEPTPGLWDRMRAFISRNIGWMV